MLPMGAKTDYGARLRSLHPRFMCPIWYCSNRRRQLSLALTGLIVFSGQCLWLNVERNLIET